MEKGVRGVIRTNLKKIEHFYFWWADYYCFIVKTKKDMPSAIRIVAIVTSCMVLATCIGFIIGFATTDIEEVDPIEYSKTTCTVLEAYVGSNEGFKTCWKVDVAYAVNGTDYTYTVVDKCVIGIGIEYEQEVDEVQREYPVNSTVTCYYEESPKTVSFDKPYDDSSMIEFMYWLSLIFGTLVSLCFVLAAFYCDPDVQTA